MRQRHRLPPTWGNCWLAIAAMFFQRRLRRIVFRRAIHPIGITKRGNAVHFTDRYDSGGVRFLWFAGRFEVFKVRNEARCQLWHAWRTVAFRSCVCYQQCRSCGERRAIRWTEDGIAVTNDDWVTRRKDVL